MPPTAVPGAIPAKRILVVDDEPPVAETTRLVLRMDGHAVEIAADAQQALLLFERGKYHLVITDYSMPGMDGLELAGELKRLCPAQPVIMITASAKLLAAEGATVPNIDLLLGKPFSVRQIREAVAKILAAG